MKCRRRRWIHRFAIVVGLCIDPDTIKLAAAPNSDDEKLLATMFDHWSDLDVTHIEPLQNVASDTREPVVVWCWRDLVSAWFCCCCYHHRHFLSVAVLGSRRSQC